ncbi:hemolysin family protein [Sedimentibacter sp. zth1]|uniref:hemolysin family protein n=1 Tax=Sedimentibacter sp. zth1 TaxID=2816908 RepID=UPI001F5EEDD4
MCEIAVISLNDSKIKKMATSGDKRAKLLLNMVIEPSKFLATIQVGVTISGFLASAIAADTFVEHIIYFFRDYNINATLLKTISLIVITIILSYFTLVLGELVPKRLALKNYERISFKSAKALSIIYKFERPMVALLSASTNGVLRLLGMDPNEKNGDVTEEEIRMMIDAGNENGAIEQSEKDMIHNVFDFDDRIVDEIMTHRTEITALEINTPLSEIINVAQSEGYSRIPVFDDDLDNIVGILYVKDLLNLVLESSVENFKVSDYMRSALYIPETNRCKDLFQEFQKTKIQMAIIVDEYGGTSGIVTMEDLLESIVGNIQDEYDDEEEEITLISDNLYKIDGMFALDKIERLFNITFPDEEEYDYDTISGYITGVLGRIPNDNEHPVISVENVDFKVLSVEEHRITKVQALVNKIIEDENNENDENVDKKVKKNKED